MDGNKNLGRLVSTRQYTAIRRKVRVINGHRMSRLLEHQGERRARAGAEIQPTRTGHQTLRQRLEQARQKASVGRIVRPVLVQVVNGLLLLGGKVVRMRYVHQPAVIATEVVAPPITMKVT